MAQVIRIYRTKVYPSVAHPGFAWKYVYSIDSPSGIFVGDGAGWRDRIAKRESLKHNRPIVKDWLSC